MAADDPLDLTVWYDYHCPYSYRVTAWLLGLGPSRVRLRFRPFALEQVNRDPDATEWRLWDQPLDYVHYRDRRNRRPLHAFLATALLEAGEMPDVVDRFRLAVYAARFDERTDISDPDVLIRAAAGAGADDHRLAAGLADEAALAGPRAGLAAAWADARARYEIFGVPTIEPAGERPFYLRLERAVAPGHEATELLDRVVGLRRASPFLLELKLPDPVEPAPTA